MKTPKEKAEDIFRKHYSELFQTDSDMSEEILISILSKKCAIISVDEILDVLNEIELEQWFEKSQYWKEVRKEIKNL